MIGAGFAGLACAHELRAAGYKVTVVEARNRVGGRVLSFQDFVAGHTCEGGAELIGSNHPTWVAYAKQFGLELIDVTDDDKLTYPVYLLGKLRSEEETEKLFEEMDAGFNSLNADAAKIDPEKPWDSPRAADLDRQNLGDWLKGLEIGPLSKAAIDIQLSSDNAVDNAQAAASSRCWPLLRAAAAKNTGPRAKSTAVRAATNSWRLSSRQRSAPTASCCDCRSRRFRSETTA